MHFIEGDYTVFSYKEFQIGPIDQCYTVTIKHAQFWFGCSSTVSNLSFDLGCTKWIAKCVESTAHMVEMNRSLFLRVFSIVLIYLTPVLETCEC